MCGGCRTVYGEDEDSLSEQTKVLPWVPEFMYDQVGTVYTSQVGIYTKHERLVTCNFSLIVSSYNNPLAQTLTLELPILSDNYNQYITINAYEGVAPGFFTPQTIPGRILPKSVEVEILINFDLMTLDQWQGSFTYISYS